MELLNPQDLLKAQPALNYFGGEAFARFLMYILKFDKINEVYSHVSELRGIEFVDQLLQVLGVNYDVDDNDLKRIPERGGFITVSNHPFGGLDGILLLKILSQKRSDVKVLANFLLKRIDPLSEYFLAVNPFEERKGAASSLSGLKMALSHVQSGGVLSIFPAGEVSSYNSFNQVTDVEWQKSVLKLIKKANVPVIPIYFTGNNSKLFHLLGLIHPQLRTIKLPSELLNKKSKTFKIRIGSPIRELEQQQFSNIYQYGRYLRAKTYSLYAPKDIEIKNFFNNFKLKTSYPQSIVAAGSQEFMVQEINSIREEHLLFTIKNFSVFCVPTKKIINTLNEIGRLREITFREVGEGTNLPIDIDEYDLYYNQLFIWDENELRIVGAYRIGLGNQIIQQYGIHGFYVDSLFKINKKLVPILNQSLELGRSFVVKDYQRKPLPLFLLWKGILYFLLKNPEYRYLIGPVSISDNYAKVSKNSMIKFITQNYFDDKLSKFVRSRKAFQFISDSEDINLLLESIGNDINKFDKLIGDIDITNNGIPVMLKKYLTLGAKILSFNVDPNFNNSLDGLIILDVYDVPQKTIESLSKEVNDGSFLERFYSSRELLKSGVNEINCLV